MELQTATSKLIDVDLTAKILGAAFKVQNSLRCGFLERVYENAMVVELARVGLTVQQQQLFR